MVIYLDNNATTAVAPAVLEAMHPHLTSRYGNASSAHASGRLARDAVEQARARVAGFLGSGSGTVVFTGSGSEANNLAVRGATLALLGGGRDTIVTQATEHPSVLETAAAMSRLHGVRVTVVGVDRYGRVDLDELSDAVDDRTAVVSVQVANGETGTLQPMTEVAAIAHRSGALLHADACQAAGKVPVDHVGADLMSVAGHKMYGPKGVGALCHRAGVELEPVIYGGGQEHGLRAGTENVAAVVGLAAACGVARQAAADGDRLRRLRDDLLKTVTAEAACEVTLNGHPTDRLPNTLNVSFHGWAGADLLAAAGGLAASTGSACHSGTARPSAVLTAMGCAGDAARGAVRLSLGRTTSTDEVTYAADLLVRASYRVGEAQRLR